MFREKQNAESAEKIPEEFLRSVEKFSGDFQYHVTKNRSPIHGIIKYSGNTFRKASPDFLWLRFQTGHRLSAGGRLFPSADFRNRKGRLCSAGSADSRRLLPLHSADSKLWNILPLAGDMLVGVSNAYAEDAQAYREVLKAIGL